MSESVKPRFAVDLGEIERQIAQAQGAPSQATSAGRSDPLAELARIVGQDDPFQSILANDASARTRNQTSANLDDFFAVRDERPVAPRAAQAQPVRHEAPDFGFDQYVQPQVRPDAEPAYAYRPAPQPQAHDGYDDAAYEQGYYEAPPPVHGYGQDDGEAYEPVAKPRSRKGLIAVGAVAGAIVLGAGGAFLLGGGSSSVTGGEPPLIAAATEPVKVPPQNPGGVEIPNQNKQIYERANQSTETKVVNREEQPVDVHQAVKMNSGDSAEATGATTARSPSHGLNLGEPRKVRTVSIRPDGTVVGAEAKAAPAPVPVPAMTMPAVAQPAAAPQQPAPKPAASTPAAAPKPAPAAEAAPQRVASAQPIAPAAPEAAPVGGFSVQLGVRSSEADAQAAYQQFQKKYAELGGVPSLIRKAEVNGNTVYRVRVGPMSREEASSLCSKLQGQGGQCFVAKN